MSTSPGGPGGCWPTRTTAFGPITGVLRSADFAAVNLETAITSGETPQPKTYHLRAPAAAFTALRDASIDLVTIAY
jgi:hypothetical protein